MKRGGYLKRRTPLRARKPLERTSGLTRSPMKRERARRVERKSPEEIEFTQWIHEQPCVMAGWMRLVDGVIVRHRCSGPIEQAHARNLDGLTGLGLKESDLNSIPLCRGLHREYDGHRGRFAGWSKERRREWMVCRLVETRARFEAAAARRAKG